MGKVSRAPRLESRPPAAPSPVREGQRPLGPSRQRGQALRGQLFWSLTRDLKSVFS